MSHNIDYFIYPEHIDRKKVQAELDDYVAHIDWQEGCQGLFTPIRWINGKVFADRNEAEKYINRIDNHNYDQIAVQFYDHECKPDDKYKELQAKADEAYKEFTRREHILYAQTVTSTFIGCKKCGSRLVRTYLKSNLCPVCQTDMRPDHMKKSVEAARSKWNRARDTSVDYLKKKAKKRVMWLVKIEYHT